MPAACLTVIKDIAFIPVLRRFLHVSDFPFKDCITAFPLAFISRHRVEREEQRPRFIGGVKAAATAHIASRRSVIVVITGDLLSGDAMNISFKDGEMTERS